MVNTIAGLISFYGYILTSPLGFIGHVCSLITFSSKTLSLTSTALLFIFLALSDIVYLFMYIYDFIAITLQVPTVSNINLCHFRTFILNFSTFTASWILVLIALDRFIRARFPFRQARLCTRKVAVCAVAILYMCAIAFTYHVLQPELAFTIPGTNLCQPARFPPTSYSIFFYNVWPILQVIVTFFYSKWVNDCLRDWFLYESSYTTKYHGTIKKTRKTSTTNAHFDDFEYCLFYYLYMAFFHLSYCVFTFRNFTKFDSRKHIGYIFKHELLLQFLYSLFNFSIVSKDIY
jgi:hypothetical protein